MKINDIKYRTNGRTITVTMRCDSPHLALLSTSPDLLEACKAALRQLDAPDCGHIPDGAVVRGRLYSAIEKAEGR